MSEKKKNILIYSFSGVLILVMIMVGGVKNLNREIEEIEVRIEDQDGIRFTDQFEVIDLMTEKSGDYIIGVKHGELDHKILEDRIETNPFVKDAQVYRDLTGTLKVNVEQSKPIARFLGKEGDRYIDTKGNVLPVNAKQTARVALLESEIGLIWKENLNESKFGSELFELLQFIESDDFWRAQIAQVVILENGEIELYPQVTKQVISFGRPENIKSKFSRLMTFYKKILPQKGWNSYERVNVKFENQIICE